MAEALYLKDLGEAYFFSVHKYCRVRYEPSTSIGKRTFNPLPIKDHWKSLAQGGFDRVDPVLSVQGGAHEVYFFRGLEAVQIKFQPKSEGDKGP
jgi:hypothetical protein